MYAALFFHINATYFKKEYRTKHNKQKHLFFFYCSVLNNNLEGKEVLKDLKVCLYGHKTEINWEISYLDYECRYGPPIANLITHCSCSSFMCVDMLSIHSSVASFGCISDVLSIVMSPMLALRHVSTHRASGAVEDQSRMEKVSVLNSLLF